MADELTEVIAEEGGKAGAEEVSDYIKQNRKAMLIELQGALRELNNAYKSDSKKLLTNNQRRSIAQQLFNNFQKQTIEDTVMKDEEHFQNNKIIIDPKRGTYVKKGLSDEAKDILASLETENLKRARDQVYQMVNEQTFINATTMAMQAVLRVRSKLMEETGLTEEIGVVYEGLDGIYLVRMPMSQFLNTPEILSTLNVVKKAISESRTSDPFQIKMGVSTVEKMIAAGARAEKVNTTTMTEYNKLVSQRIQKYKVHYIRETAQYEVLNPVGKDFQAQTGFVAEAIIEQYLFGGNYKYSQDNSPWFARQDIERDGISLSLKNMLSGDPTLVRLNSVHSILEYLINQLSSPQTDTQVQANITNKLKATLPKNQIEKYAYKVLEQSGLSAT